MLMTTWPGGHVDTTPHSCAEKEYIPSIMALGTLYHVATYLSSPITKIDVDRTFW